MNRHFCVASKSLSFLSSVSPSVSGIRYQVQLRHEDLLNEVDLTLFSDSFQNVSRYRAIHVDERDSEFPESGASDCHICDIDAVFSEDGAHQADDTGLVAVVDKEDVACRSHVDMELSLIHI